MSHKVEKTSLEVKDTQPSSTFEDTDNEAGVVRCDKGSMSVLRVKAT